jgi:hypothetical protein
VRALLYIALDVGYLDEHTSEQLRKQTEEISLLLGSLGASLARARGRKA